MSEPSNVLYRIQRGLAGYVSYLAACEMNSAFSEYVLYEPILRILTARGFVATCEEPCPGYKPEGPGDKPRIDFKVTNKDLLFAIEVKWAKKRRLQVSRDIEKLRLFREHHVHSRSFLCVFGTERVIKNIEIIPAPGKEIRDLVLASFGVTRYGCRIYETGRSAR